MINKIKSKFQDLQNYTRDYNEWKNNEHVWEMVLTTQIDDNKPQIYHDCFLKGWIASIYSNFANASFIGLLDTAGASQDLTANQNQGDIQRNAGSTNQGIAVGTGNTAVDVADNAIETIINSGVSTGQLIYGPVAIGPMEVDADGAISWNISRSFQNRSGGSITVEEIGLQHRLVTTGGIKIFLLDRTLSTNVLADNARLLVTYTISQS